MGWNSTAQDAADQGGAARFNSQRDGILRRLNIGGSRKIKVSIPNGMEFYRNADAFAIGVGCFNSQRDGILLSLAHTSIATWVVSIPNRMESC